MTNSYYAAYLRDSGGEEQELSIEQQEKEIRTWCLDKDYILTVIFKDEARPGSSAVTREAFQAMMHHFRSDTCQEQGVIIWKFSRFARDIDDAQFYKADLRRRGYQVISMKDSVPDGLNGRFFEAAVDWMNAKFLEDLSTDVKRGLRHLVSEYGAIPGTPPRGFKREPVTIGMHRDGKPHTVHKWVPDPEYWDRCRLAWEMRAAGATYKEIHAATRLYGSKNSYSDFFRNRLYLGEMRFADIVIPDYVDPLITPAIWDAVQARHHKRGANITNGDHPENHPRRKASSFVLSGYVRCAQCGAPMNMKNTYPRKKSNSHGISYGYYECSREQRLAGCTARQIPRKALENIVIETIKNEILRPDNLATVQEKAAQATKVKTDHRQIKIDTLRGEISKVQHELNNLTEAIASLGMNDTLVKRFREAEGQKQALNQQLDQLQHLPEPGTPWTSEQLSTFSNQIITALEEASDPKTIKAILSGILRSVVAERDGNKIIGMIYYISPTDNENSGVNSFGRNGHIPPGGTLPNRQIFTQPFGVEIKGRSRN